MRTAIKISGEPLNLPTEWTELTVKQYRDVRTLAEPYAILSSLSGISADTCKQITPEYFSLLLDPVAQLLDTEIPIMPVTDIDGIEVPKDIGKKEFSRKANADASFKKEKDELFLLRLVAIYLAKGTDDKDIALMETELLTANFVKVISAGHQLFTNYVLLCRSESKIPSPEYEPEELAAGVKKFAQYGVFGIVRSIALRYGTTIDEVYKWSYNRVLLELKISAEESIYERRLRKILNRKK